MSEEMKIVESYNVTYWTYGRWVVEAGGWWWQAEISRSRTEEEVRQIAEEVSRRLGVTYIPVKVEKSETTYAHPEDVDDQK